MAQIILIIFAAYMIVSAAYVALIILLVAGLIFRTKETLGLVFICAVIGLLKSNPMLKILGILGFCVITRLGEAYLLIRDRKNSRVRDASNAP